MNRVILVGRLGQDPETRYTQSGKCVATFSLAVSKPGKDSGTDWFDIVVWDKLAEVVGNNLSKGRRILVEGRLQTRSYEAKDGSKRRVTEVVAQNVEFLDSKNGNAPKEDANNQNGYGFGPSVPDDQDIPF